VEAEMNTMLDIDVRELDRRNDDGFDVVLLWSSSTNQVFVTIVDERDGESFEIEVDPADALDAFHHAFAYAASGIRPRRRAGPRSDRLDTELHPRRPRRTLSRRGTR
jgi:hypothetical protein